MTRAQTRTAEGQILLARAWHESFQVRQQLRLVHGTQPINGLKLDHDSARNDEVGSVATLEFVALVANRDGALLLEEQAT